MRRQDIQPVARASATWRGALAKPIKWRGPAIANAQKRPELQDRLRDAHMQVLREQLSKVHLLADLFEVSPDDYLTLLLRLAMATVPGFQIEFLPRRAGRKKKWDQVRELQLIADVEVIKRERGGCPTTTALSVLLKRYPERYGRPPDKAKAIHSLANRHSAARRAAFASGVLSADGAGDIAMDIWIAHFAADPKAAAEANARLAGSSARPVAA